MKRHALITGATGLVGGAVLERMLRADRALHAYVLVRDPERWHALAPRFGSLLTRVTPLRGDITLPHLGLSRSVRQRLMSDVSVIVHCAADTRFSQPQPRARRYNRDGTRHMLALAAGCTALERFVHLSTAFVAGRMTGVVPETALDEVPGWVNAYEQSKHEAERLVRAAGVPWLILRSSTIACDGADGRISQLNAVHRALELYRAGLASMVPGSESAPVDLVTTDFVAGAAARLASSDTAAGLTLHLCAGAHAITLGELLDRAYLHWQRDGRWRRRGVERPALASLETYRLFEQAVEETGDARLRAITRSLTHFVPQLALPKHFETQRCRAALGYAAEPVAHFIDALLASLAQRRADRRAGRAA